MARDGQRCYRRVHAEFMGVVVAVSVVLAESLDTINDYVGWFYDSPTNFF